jgi:serine O-acetyltransferase
MIKTKEDLLFYIAEDKKKNPYGFKDFFLKYHTYYIGRYLYHMRKVEYYTNKKNRNLIDFLRGGGHKLLMRKYSYKIGLQIPPNTMGPGVNITHFGTIIINSSVRAGKNLSLYPGVIIGVKDNKVPIIGDDVWIFGGCKIIGGVNIGNGAIIGPILSFFAMYRKMQKLLEFQQK